MVTTLPHAQNLKNGYPAGHVVRGVKQCTQCGALIDRDVNGALNIAAVALAALRGEERPAHLQRPSAA